MARLLIVVASQTGRTRRLAEELAAGAREAGAEVELLDAREADPASLERADAVVLGSGVHMGGVESSMSAFLERTAPLWLQGRLVGRLGAAFSSAGNGVGGGGELVLVTLLAALAEHGCLLVPMPKHLQGFADGGSHWGPLAWSNPRGGEAGPTARHLAAARAQGRFIAECAARWRAGGGSAAGGPPTPGSAPG